MLIQTSSRELSRTLKIVSKAIASRSTMPLFENAVILQQSDGTFRIIGGSIESKISIPISISVIEGKEIPPIAIKPKCIMPVVDSMPDTVLTIKIIPGFGGVGTLQFSHLSGEFKVPYVDGSEYPVPTPFDNALCSIHLPAEVILPTIDQARPFAANDELRPVLGTVLLDITPDECIVVATNGHYLYRRVIGNGSHGNSGAPFFDEGSDTKMMIPAPLLSILSTAFAKFGDINFSTNGNIVRIWTDNVEYHVQSIDGRYPNYNSVIPPLTSAHTLDVAMRPFLSVLRRVSPFASEASQMLRLAVKKSVVELSAEDVDYATSAYERVECDTVSCPDTAVGLKSTSLQMCLQALGSDNIRFHISSPTQSVVFTDTDINAHILTLLCPMRLE